MLNANQIVSAWLEGSDIVAGMENPAGSMLVGSQAAPSEPGESSHPVLETRPIYCDVSVISNTCFG